MTHSRQKSLKEYGDFHSQEVLFALTFHFTNTIRNDMRGDMKIK